MAEIKEAGQFNADRLGIPIVGVAAQAGKHDSGIHKHRKHQLLFVSSGCMSINLNGLWCVLPPNRAAWIPAGTEHRIKMRNPVAYRAVYFDAKISGPFPKKTKVIAVNNLLKELIERMAYWEWEMLPDEQKAIFFLFCQEFSGAQEEHFTLALPVDRRLKRWLSDVMEERVLPAPLVEMAKGIGASAKTISRIFTRETGLPYQSWRQQWRLQAAIERLSEGDSVSDVARGLRFSSDSAFISFFRKMTGNTPGRYLRDPSE